MNRIIPILLLGITAGWVIGPQKAKAQACQDEEGMVTEYKKGLIELVETVRKESPTEFEKAYHQKAGVTKLGLASSMVDGLLDCLDKAAQDPAAKDELDLKSRHATYSKLKDQLEADKKTLKAANDPKSAQAAMVKFQYSN